MFRIEVQNCCSFDGGNDALVGAAHQAGVPGLTTCHVVRLFFLQGSLSRLEAEQLAEELLADAVVENAVVIEPLPAEAATEQPPDFDGYPLPTSGYAQVPSHTVDVTFLPGVTDPAAENLVRAAHTLGITALEQAATGQRYLLYGNVSEREARQLAVRVFSNPVVQQVAINRPIAPPFVPFQQADPTVEAIPLRSADDPALQAISTARRLALDLSEMQAIRDYYQQEGRDPTDAELETLAQTWSEHCYHKTFKALVQVQRKVQGNGNIEEIEEVEKIDGLLRTCIRGATEQLGKPWVRSAFVDNAGVIAFNDRWDLAFKVETHNHPSALEPFGGANTGVGGVVRDILGVSARPIANTDVLCFGPPDLPEDEVPEGVLSPHRIAEGVIHGIEDYGNKMGIPTVNGAIVYHQGYTANPLVFCGCLGLLPRGQHPTEPQTGDHIVVVGGRTGRDGLRGATFSSMEMDQTTGEIAGSAVQIGHPIHEKQVQEVIIRARDEHLYHAITDCGAGGLASAVGEMGQYLGAHVQLERVALKYAGLRPWEIWLSEAQERMVLAVPPAHWERLKVICDGQDIEAVSIGHFEASGRLRLFYEHRPVGDLSMDFLHHGLPQRRLTALWPDTETAGNEDQEPGRGQKHPEDEKGNEKEEAEEKREDLTATLLALLAHPNIRSKEPVIRRYDHEVQGSTVVKPLVGVANHGPGDATVLVPLEGSGHWEPDGAGPQPGAEMRGVALSVGICPAYGELDPYTMAWAAIDEAMRNIAAVGADPDQVALLDNFCWGNPKLPDRLGSLVRCVQGCYDAALAYGAPFISGKDSLNNEYTGADGRKHAIPGTLLISAVGMVPDVQRTVTMDLKQAGNRLYLVGETRNEPGGNHYVQVQGGEESGAAGLPPQPVSSPLERLRAIHRAIVSGLVQACHDCSEGGIGVALAEMAIAGRVGAEVDLTAVPAPAGIRDVERLFSESLSRFVVEVRPEHAQAFEALFKDIPHACIGTICALPLKGTGRRHRCCASVAPQGKRWCGQRLPTLRQRGGGSRPAGSRQEQEPRQSRNPSPYPLPPYPRPLPSGRHARRCSFCTPTAPTATTKQRWPAPWPERLPISCI
ncbi:MAG: phosphoribosylformylglycinamidine synthase subunit PurL [Chloroflexaceae bacterium]|nr:phosphoribosylformylglycinamidine synthase subunit PurL [Chloroflexaceae bacterium]